MATAVGLVIQRGFAKSAAARQQSFEVTDELVQRVGQCEREVFEVLARENPYMLGTSLQVSFNGSGWPRPEDAMRVLDVLADIGTVASPALTVGDPIRIVPYDDKLFYEGYASLTELGQVFVPCGQDMDPSGGTVTMIYARGPEMPEDEDSTIDALIPSFFDDIWQQDIAAYLAAKEKRTDDMTFFLGQKDGLIAQLVDWSQLQTYSLQQRFPIVTPPLTSAARGRAQPEKGSE